MGGLLFRRPLPEAQAADDARTAIIDIGSNSVRLVVYQGPARLPATLFNEKVMAGLGRGLGETGAIAAGALATARTALARFAAIAREMGVARVRTVATAAVRDAVNGDALISAARALGLEVELLTGNQEAIAAGYGVISASPEADGIVGDLGGGSLELVRVRGGRIEDSASFPLGVLRIAPIRAAGRQVGEHIASVIDAAGWRGRGAGLPFYLVGGSWRGLARVAMHEAAYPLPIVHGYALSAETVARFGQMTGRFTKASLRAVPGLAASRAATLGDAATLLAALFVELGSERGIASAFGLREGLLYAELDEETRGLDPLIVAAREEGRLMGRFPEHGDLLDAWLAPLFDGDAAEAARLRHAACLLADVGWRANPEFRAERGVEIALHGNWVGIDAGGRAQVAQALYTCLGGGTATPDPIPALTRRDGIDRATAWGLAMRLGQRLSGGLAGPLQRTRLSADERTVTLWLTGADRALYGESVERRHTALAGALERRAVVAP